MKNQLLARHTVGHKFGSKGRGTNGAGTAKGAGGGGGGKEERRGVMKLHSSCEI